MISSSSDRRSSLCKLYAPLLFTRIACADLSPPGIGHVDMLSHCGCLRPSNSKIQEVDRWTRNLRRKRPPAIDNNNAPAPWSQESRSWKSFELLACGGNNDNIGLGCRFGCVCGAFGFAAQHGHCVIKRERIVHDDLATLSGEFNRQHHSLTLFDNRRVRLIGDAKHRYRPSTRRETIDEIAKPRNLMQVQLMRSCGEIGADAEIGRKLRESHVVAREAGTAVTNSTAQIFRADAAVHPKSPSDDVDISTR